MISGSLVSHDHHDTGTHCGGHCHTQEDYWHYKLDVVTTAVSEIIYHGCVSCNTKQLLFRAVEETGEMAAREAMLVQLVC